ncbi:NAD(P)/FAD-dependent oxidoreductase [Clostridium tetanomorphum]|uniref:FAD-dependent oxidoreductase n=1 Tax=Clostridium tetanomorphum TaxID=1553 RepID=A0A923EDL4_CLOTT|nr:FAD-dependent oxidoreductase [Clostridium tetanomorphum]MBC2400159.1 FAD-dependent oxidoreductase [Clostridium tetanomorphum]NRZ95355.1 L-2-hydroxyglutarate oxidase LhgO [Clostridium tetanomorphum]
MDYDVLILGGGIIGCAVAYELSKYSLNIALIEKDYDIADDVALINSAIVYDGVECEDTLMAKLEMMGNEMFDELSIKINVPFKRCGSLIISENKEQEYKLYNIYERAIKRDIKNIFLLDSKDIVKLEPNLTINPTKGLYSKNTGVICPYDLAIAYGEIAFDNGVKFRLEEEVIDIEKITKGFRVITNKNKFTCKMVINTTPGQNYSIDTSEKVYKNKSNLSYFLLEKDYKEIFNNILFTLNESRNNILAVPTVQGNMMVAVNDKDMLNYNETLKKVSHLIGSIDESKINDFYQWPFYKDTIMIDKSLIDKGYIKVVGKHYAQVTMTPSIAKMVCETVISNINCVLKKDFVDKRREFYRFRDLSNKERNKIIKMNKKYGKMVCICQKVTEGEIVDAIRRPLGARTVEGIKRRTGVIFGNCKGAECLSKIASILARETNKKLDDIVKDSKNSKIMTGRIKEFD